MPARLLVLEDDATLRALLVEALRDAGYHVVGVGSSAEALQAAGSAEFELVVTDVRMEGMDGIAFLAALRGLQPLARSIVITGYASDDAPGRAILAQAEDYIYKPFSMSVLLASVQRVLASEEEASGYQKVVGAVMAGYQRLKDKVAAARATAELSAVNKERDRAFQALYVGARSGLLKQGDARGTWDHLERVEAQRERFKAAEPDAPDRAELVTGYRYVLDLVTAYSRSSQVHLDGKRGGEQVPPPLFARFFRRLKAGEISPEQVKVAPFLRCMDPELRLQSEALERLYQTMWGETSS